MKIEKLRITLLGVIVALATACGGPVPSNGTIPRDDASTTNPETAVAPDAPSPTPDVAPRDDAGSPTPDAVAVDAAVTPDVPTTTDVATVDTATPSPPVDASTGFDPNLCRFIHESMLQVDGSTMRPESPNCYMEADGTATMVISASFAGAFGCGESEAVCRGSTCQFGGTLCSWTGLSIGIMTFHAHSARAPDATVYVHRL